MSRLILGLDDAQATLETVGGKGMSLSRLSREGIPVPGGFHLTIEAYRRFVSENGLDMKICEAVRIADKLNPESLEKASGQIEDLFTKAKIPADIVIALKEAYGEMGEPAVAVRSSATTEDLPEASFAGQQDTFLNIRGKEAIIDAIKHCWASLWTGRAIGYRINNGINQESIAIAVIVQELFNAEASGVMFTANPLNGSRNEIVINAAWGLGEAIVSGIVTPDTYTVEKTSGRILKSIIAVKNIMTVRAESGTGEQPVSKRIRKKQAISGFHAQELARLGLTIEKLYNMPMDIEWAFAKGKFAILQARPVTSLLEPPLDWTNPRPKALLMRMSFAEFVPNAVSPLFATFGVPIAEKATAEMYKSWMGFDDPQSFPFAVVNGYVYIGMVPSLKMIWAIVKAARWAIKKMITTGYERWKAVLEKYRALVETWQGKELAGLSPSELLAGAKEIFSCTVECYNVAQSGIIPSATGSELSLSRFYNILVRHKGDPEASVFLIGLDSLPLRAEKSLFDLSQWIISQPGLTEYFRKSNAKEIYGSLSQADSVPAGLESSWAGFVSRFHLHLSEYGHTIYDLDFANPVPADDPVPLIEALKAYIDGKGSNPYVRGLTLKENQEKAAGAILSRIGKWRGKWFRKLLKWAQEAAPKREDSISDLGLGYPVLRSVFSELGNRLTVGGAIVRPENIYWLESRELDALTRAMEKGEKLQDYSLQTEERKKERQKVRNARVPLVLPEKSLIAKIMEHGNGKGNLLKGLGASGGRVTARACILRDPKDFGRMRPGDVIVTVTTTPAWTPLFAMASAIVTEIGGPLSHSSIVAREYGIPAVLAVGNATRLIRDGQIVTVDGSLGIVNINKNLPDL